ncbi:hypothetical protein Q7P37_009007 [Cladosporium fusiforme]
MGFLRHHMVAMALAGLSAGQSLPYNPSRILRQRNSTTAYIFEPSQDESGQFKFLSLDLSKTISTEDTSFTTNSDTLPFLENDKQIPFTPMMDTSNGHIVAVTGDCSKGPEGISIYTLLPDEDGDTGNGTWREHEASGKEIGDKGENAGANYLAAGMAFSAYTNGSFSDSTLYLFGGMCPFANSTQETWASGANYSNMMLAMTAQSESVDDLDYEINLAPGRGPPIAEAGFTITGLPPTFSDKRDDAPQYQQQDFILLGGHTQAAFINMSQVAMFSLPQESWSFLPVIQPSAGKTDLATRQDIQEVEPRSGHTAVLNEEGDGVIIFGGWVGDVETPAQPQLAVLRFGVGYGGRGGWTWTVPEQTGEGLADAAGIYGHGATMLSGGIMMIVGGYSIPTSSSDKTRRDTDAFNNKVLLFNTTSNSWIQSYEQPGAAAQQEEQKSGALSRSSQKAGLGVGITFGILLLAALVMFYFWYSRKLKREREDRERVLLTRASDNSFGQPFLEKGTLEGQHDGPSVIGDYWQHSRTTEEHDPWTHQPAPQTGNTTGLFSDKPSPTRGLRKGAPHKNYQYHPAPPFDENRMSHGSGIHPIAEHEDEDAISRLPSISDDITLSEAQKQLREVERALAPQRESQRWSDDPFRDPEPNPLGSHPYSPVDRGDTVRRVPTNASRTASPRRKHNPWDLDGVPNWTSEYRPDEPLLLHSTGRISPSRSDDRTSSTLSDMSHRSVASGNSMVRTVSTRTGAILAAAAAATTAMAGSRSASRSPDRHSFSEEPFHLMQRDSGRKSPFSLTGRARTNTDPSVHNQDADSFMTARTSFVQLQNEGEALLGGRPLADRDDPYQRAQAANPNTRSHTTPTSPIHHPDLVPAALQSRKRPQGLIGSIRRAIGAISHGESRSFSLTASAKPPYQAEHDHEHERSASSSPTKSRPNVPRRAMSDGGYLLRQKRGQKDWSGPAEGAWEPYRDDDDNDWGHQRAPASPAEAEEEDWDVENAATQRDVQVMFTVPKTRLRVVNDDMDRASLRSASDGAVSRSGSTRTENGAAVRRQGSRGVLNKQGSKSILRIMSEGNTMRLGDMPEDGEEDAGRYRD